METHTKTDTAKVQEPVLYCLLNDIIAYALEAQTTVCYRHVCIAYRLGVHRIPNFAIRLHLDSCQILTCRIRWHPDPNRILITISPGTTYKGVANSIIRR